MDIGIFGFAVLAFFRSVFCAKRLRFFGFGVRCDLRISRFLASGFRFSGKIIVVFRFYYPMWFVFGFRFWPNFLAVLQFLIYPNVPLIYSLQSAVVI